MVSPVLPSFLWIYPAISGYFPQPLVFHLTYSKWPVYEIISLRVLDEVIKKADPEQPHIYTDTFWRFGAW